MNVPDDTAAALAWLAERGITGDYEKAIELGFIPPESRAVVPAGRDALGRFAAGNPGKPKGAKKKIIARVEQMLADLAPDAAQTVSENVRNNVGVATWVLAHFVKPSGRHVELSDVPAIRSAADVPAAVEAIIEAIAKGELSVEDGSVLIGLLGKTLEVLAMAHRMRGSMLLPPPEP